jgi:uncharacterized protein YecT (DUF1311 family)
MPQFFTPCTTTDFGIFSEVGCASEEIYNISMHSSFTLSFFVVISFFVTQAAMAARLNEDSAMALAYPTYNKKTSVAKVETPSEAKGGFFNDTAFATALLLKSYQDGKTERAVLLTKLTPADMKEFNCHRCVPEVEVFDFAQENGDWKLIPQKNRRIGPGGSYGNANHFETVAIGPEALGLMSTGWDLAHGNESTDLSLYARANNTWSEVFSLVTMVDDDSSECPTGINNCTDNYQANWKLLKSIHNGFYDIQTESEGLKSESKSEGSKPAQPFHEQSTLVFDGHSYKGGEVKSLPLSAFLRKEGGDTDHVAKRIDLSQESQSAYRNVDQEMSLLYFAQFKSLKGDAKKKFKQEQLAWIARKESLCGPLRKADDSWDPTYADCARKETQVRLNQLKK